MSLKEIFKIVFSWRLILILVAIPAIFFLPPRTRFTNFTGKPSLSNIFSMWSNFDGVRYLSIAEHGYDYQHKSVSDYAIFPIFPWTIKTFNFFGNYLASGLIVSHLFLILALYFLYKLILFDFKAKIARSAIYLLLIFPGALFFGSVYSESLFLLLSVLVFYFARKQNFFLACIFAALASATRFTGIFLWPAVIYEYWVENGSDLKKSFNPSAIWLILPSLGLLSFMRFLAQRTSNPFFFITSQIGAQVQAPDKLILLHQVFFRYFRMIIFTDHWDPLFFTVILELFVATLVLVILIFSFKKIRFSYWLYSVLSYLLPTFTGSFSGLPRFMAVLFPLFIFLALSLEKNHPYLKYLYYIFSVAFSILAVIFFTRGYFVS